METAQSCCPGPPDSAPPYCGSPRIGQPSHPDAHRRHHPVGHLDAHHGALVGNRRNAHAAAAQGQGDVIGQVGELGQLHPLVQGKFVPGDAGPVDHVAGLGVHAEAGDGLGQAAGVVPQLRPHR